MFNDKEIKDIKKAIRNSLIEYLTKNPMSKDYIVLNMKFANTGHSHPQVYEVNVLYHLKDGLTEVVVSNIGSPKILQRIQYNEIIKYNKFHDRSGLPQGSNYVTWKDTHKEMMMKNTGLMVKDVTKPVPVPLPYGGKVESRIEKEEGLATQLLKMYEENTKHKIKHKIKLQEQEYQLKLERAKLDSLRLRNSGIPNPSLSRRKQPKPKPKVKLLYTRREVIVAWLKSDLFSLDPDGTWEMRCISALLQAENANMDSKIIEILEAEVIHEFCDPETIMELNIQPAHQDRQYDHKILNLINKQ